MREASAEEIRSNLLFTDITALVFLRQMSTTLISEHPINPSPGVPALLAAVRDTAHRMGLGDLARSIAAEPGMD